MCEGSRATLVQMYSAGSGPSDPGASQGPLKQIWSWRHGSLSDIHAGRVNVPFRHSRVTGALRFWEMGGVTQAWKHVCLWGGV